MLGLALAAGRHVVAKTSSVCVSVNDSSARCGRAVATHGKNNRRVKSGLWRGPIHAAILCNACVRSDNDTLLQNIT